MCFEIGKQGITTKTQIQKEPQSIDNLIDITC